VAAGTSLTFTTPAVTGAATSSPSLGPITVQLTAADGTPVTSGVTVQLSSSSAGTNEFSATAGGTPVTSVVIPAGSSAASFYYGDDQAGQPVITASADGVPPASQIEMITADPAATPSSPARPTGTPGTATRPPWTAPDPVTRPAAHPPRPGPGGGPGS
jgi:hypothetical protein